MNFFYHFLFVTRGLSFNFFSPENGSHHHFVFISGIYKSCQKEKEKRSGIYKSYVLALKSYCKCCLSLNPRVLPFSIIYNLWWISLIFLMVLVFDMTMDKYFLLLYIYIYI